MTGVLSCRGVDAGYGERLVLSGIDLELRPGELLALAGPNGAGKTTLLRLLDGSDRPQAGAVLLDGRPVSAMGNRERARAIARVSQELRADWAYSVRETVAMGRFAFRGWFAPEGKADRLAVEAALERSGCAELAERSATELSGGELQRVLIARALAQEARILLLDEPVSHLDLKHQTSVMALARGLADQGWAVAASLHDLNLAGQYADRIALLSGGRIAALGSPAEVLTEKLLRGAFGAAVVVGSHPDDASPYVYHPAPRRGLR